MKRYFNFAAKIFGLSVLAIAPLMLSNNMASAQPTGTDANYVGGGVATSVTSGGQGNDGAKFGGNIQGRIAVPNLPFSARGAVLFSDKTSAIMPILTYDIPVTNGANVYVGGGYSFVEADGKPTPLGNRDSTVVTAGVEAQVGENIVVYGDTKLGLKAYQNSPASALSFQVGAGYRF